MISPFSMRWLVQRYAHHSESLASGVNGHVPFQLHGKKLVSVDAGFNVGLLLGLFRIIRMSHANARISRVNLEDAACHTIVSSNSSIVG